MVGYTSRIPGTDRLLNALRWDKPRSTRCEWQPHPTAFELLAAAGVHTTVVNKREFDGTRPHRAAHRGARRSSARDRGRRADRAAAVAAAGDRRR